jgi:hypothetical protein
LPAVVVTLTRYASIAKFRGVAGHGGQPLGAFAVIKKAGEDRFGVKRMWLKVWNTLVGWVRQESVAATALVQAFIAIGIAFAWWSWSTAQTGAVFGITSALLAMFVRSQVTPLHPLRAGGRPEPHGGPDTRPIHEADTAPIREPGTPPVHEPGTGQIPGPRAKPDSRPDGDGNPTEPGI